MTLKSCITLFLLNGHNVTDECTNEVQMYRHGKVKYRDGSFALKKLFTLRSALFF